jgi:hypothetical protein
MVGLVITQFPSTLEPACGAPDYVEFVRKFQMRLQISRWSFSSATIVKGRALVRSRPAFVLLAAAPADSGCEPLQRLDFNRHIASKSSHRSWIVTSLMVLLNGNVLS